MMIYFLLDLDDENENYPYQLIEFIKKGRPSTKEIELVPTSWIKFESGGNKMPLPRRSLYGGGARRSPQSH